MPTPSTIPLLGSSQKASSTVLQLPGIAYSYSTTTAQPTLTGDIDLRVLAEFDDWYGTGAFVHMLTKWGAGGNMNSSWNLQRASGMGSFHFMYRTSSLIQSQIYSGLHGITTGVWWIRVTRQWSGGNLTFMKSLDNVNWTTISSHTQDAGARLNGNTVPIEVGSFQGGYVNATASPWKCHAVEIRGQMFGEPQAAARYTEQVPGMTSWYDIYGNLWNVLGTAAIVSNPS